MGLKVCKSCSIIPESISIKTFCPSTCCTKNVNRQHGGQNFEKYILQFKKSKRVHKSVERVPSCKKISPSDKKGSSG